MNKRRRRPLTGWVLLAVLAVIIIGLLAFLAHLGGEQPQSVVEQPVTLPAASKGAEQ